jgi:hypothetical protein
MSAPQRFYVQVDIKCERCGAQLAHAYQHRVPGLARESNVDGRGGQLLDGPTGGKLHCACACGARPQVRWQRVVDRLDTLDEGGEFRVSMRI